MPESLIKESFNIAFDNLKLFTLNLCWQYRYLIITAAIFSAIGYIAKILIGRCTYVINIMCGNTKRESRKRAKFATNIFELGTRLNDIFSKK